MSTDGVTNSDGFGSLALCLGAPVLAVESSLYCTDMVSTNNTIVYTIVVSQSMTYLWTIIKRIF